MKASINEVMTLTAKAARGAGAPPAQATAFGRAAVYHLAASRQEDDLTSALEALPEGPIIAVPLEFIALAAHQPPTAILHSKASPELLHSYAQAQPLTTVLALDGAHLRASVDPQTPAARPCVLRIALSDALAQLLNRYAARTLVPESDASRISGAGAGLTDND